MAYATRPGLRFASWLTAGAQSADRAVSNPASLGAGRDMIGFGGGQPASELYPLEALERAFSRAILEDGRNVLPYGPSEGLPALRHLVAERVAQRGIQLDGPENVLILTGSLQGIHLVGRIMLDVRDVIVTEAPTFMGALMTWEHQHPRYVPVPVDEHGLVISELERALEMADTPPKFIYTQPTFQNPSGVSLAENRRQQLIELAREHDLLILEDDPYGEFWFDEGKGPVQPLRSMPGAEDVVVYLGTFSKIVAPGLRLAYAVARPDLIQLLARAKRGLDFHTETVVQQAIVRLLQDPAFDLEAHIAAGRRMYRSRRDAMLDALEATFTSETKWTRPDGGFFLWLDLPRDVSAAAVTAAAQTEGVAVFAGSTFYPGGEGGFNGLRLSYSNASPERIREGVERLHRAFTTVAE
jgi:2-aminoadipate transaminase